MTCLGKRRNSDWSASGAGEACNLNGFAGLDVHAETDAEYVCALPHSLDVSHEFGSVEKKARRGQKLDR